MNYRYLLAAMFLCMGMSPSLQAQDPTFIQFENAPTNLNPALTGFYVGNHRLAVNYRDQWSNLLRGDAYTSLALAYDAKVRLSDSMVLGLGINGTADSSGELDYGTSQGSYLASIIKRFGSDSTRFSNVSLGLQYGIVERSVDYTNARWPSQHDGNGGFDPTLEPGTIPDVEFMHSDFSAGLVWETVFSSRSNIRFGLAIHHINKATISFLDNDNTVSIRRTFHASGEVPLNEKFSLSPSAMYMSQGEHNQLLIGTSFAFYPIQSNRDNAFQLGIWRRFGNDVSGGINANTTVFSAMARLKKFSMGFSYDITDSSVPNGIVSAKAIELSFGFLFNRTTGRSIINW